MYNKASGPIWAFCTLDFCHKNWLLAVTEKLQWSAMKITTSNALLLICMGKSVTSVCLRACVW